MKRILCILIISGLIFSTTQVVGRPLTVGQNALEDLKIRIYENGIASVVHEVKGDKTKPVQVEMFNDNLTNFSVVDQDGNSAQYSTLSGSPMNVLIMPTDRNVTYIKYDLPNIVSNKDGVWEWKYLGPSDIAFTDFYFPKGVDMIWVYDEPAYLGEKGSRIHGNGFPIHYVINESVSIQNVQWQDKSFNVGIITATGLGKYVFYQSKQYNTLDLTKPNSFVTIIMPQELLWGP